MSHEKGLLELDYYSGKENSRKGLFSESETKV